MEIILSKDMAPLGKIGEVVKVKDGYARNFLFPKKLACLATPANIKNIEHQKKKQQVEHDNQKKAALERAEKLSKVSCTVNVEVNDLDKMYGSVNESDIVNALQVEGVEIDRKDLIIEKPIEELGIFEIGIKVHPEVTAKIRLWVTKK